VQNVLKPFAEGFRQKWFFFYYYYRTLTPCRMGFSVRP